MNFLQQKKLKILILIAIQEILLLVYHQITQGMKLIMVYKFIKISFCLNL